MIPMQVITLETNDRFLQVEIRKRATNQYIISIASKTKITEEYYSEFLELRKLNADAPEIFNTAEDALKHVATKFVSSIIKIKNKTSDLLTTDEIKIITGCNKVEEV